MLQNILRKRLVKMGVQKAIGLLPERLAFSLNEASIRLVQGSVQHRIDTVERANTGLSHLKIVEEDVAFDIRGASVLELGTGWHGVDIILLHLLGAARIVTVDHWPHLNFEAIRDQVRNIHAKRDSLDFEAFGRTQQIYERLEALAHTAAKCRSLEDLLSALQVSYNIAKSGDVTKLNLSEESFDLLYTMSVLQRIPEKPLFRIIDHVGNNLLSENGAFFVNIDQKDIHTQEHVGNEAWGLEYLKYSDWVWNLLSSEKLNCQNRLRESDFLNLLNNANMRVLKVYSVVEEEDMKRLQGMRLARRFRGYDLRDLAVKASIIVGRKDLAGTCVGSVE